MPSFISPLIREPGRPWVLRNRRTRAALASAIETAVTSADRRRGLLGRDALSTGGALVIAPCSSIHMFFMRFSIDVVFAARDGRVVKAYGGVRPWRIAGALGGFAAIELPTGVIAESGTRAGDYLEVVEGPLATSHD